MNLFVISITVVAVVVWLVYKTLTKHWEIFNERGIPFDKPILALGNFRMYKESVFDTIEKMYKKYENEKVFGFFNFTSPDFVLRDVELIKQITIKDFDSFVNHDKTFDEHIDGIMGKSLFSMFDERWRVMRNALSPLFTSSKMKMMFEVVSECALDFVGHFEKKALNGRVIIDAQETFARYTVDGISTAALGFKGDCIENEDSSLFKIAKGLTTPSTMSNIKLFLAVLAKPIYLLLQLQFFPKEVRSFFQSVIVDVMREREEKNIFRPDIIELLIQAKKGKIEARDKDDGKDLKNFSANIEYDVGAKGRKVINWTDDDFIAQGAGFDTTKNLLQSMSYELAMNQNVQKELIEEVDDVISASNGKPVTYEALHKMKFLDQVVSESLRFWPPVMITNRECNKDYTMNLGSGKTLRIMKGERVMIPVGAIHRDPKNFENPNVFDPHRFDDDKKDFIVPGSFIPFGYGPRVCIGSRFALMEAKLIIFNILSKFTIEVCDKTPEKLTLSSTFGMFDFKDKIFVEFKTRANVLN